MTVSNMTIEAGARAGLIAPDETTFAYLEGRPMAPKGDLWRRAVGHWRTLPSDPEARYAKEVALDVSEIVPLTTWGTSPEDVVPITGTVPDPQSAPSEEKRASMQRALDYMGLAPGTNMADVPIDRVFVGSCTNGRIEDLRAVAAVAKGRRVADGVRAMIVPGSGLVKRQAEEEGIADVLMAAGFEWREPGCSMCPRDELRPARARRAMRVDHQPQLRRPAGTRGAHASREPGDGGGGRGHRAPGRRARADAIAPKAGNPALCPGALAQASQPKHRGSVRCRNSRS